MEKRGLSEVIMTTIMIALILIAVGIVWVVARNILVENAVAAQEGVQTISLDLSSVKQEAGNLVVGVNRGVGAGELVGVEFLVVGDGFSRKVVKPASLEELGGQTFTITLADLGGNATWKVNTISIYPVIKSSGGDKTLYSGLSSSVNLLDLGWILVWQGLPTQARYSTKHEGEIVNLANDIQFNELKMVMVNTGDTFYANTSETAVLKWTIPGYFQDLAANKSFDAFVAFHGVSGIQNVTLFPKGLFMYGYNNSGGGSVSSWKVFNRCVNVGSDGKGEYMYLAVGGCPSATKFNRASVECYSTNNAYCIDSLNTTIPDATLGLTKRQFQETKVFVRLSQ